MTPYVSATEAAELLGMSLATVKRRCEAKAFDAVKDGSGWRILRASLPLAGDAEQSVPSRVEHPEMERLRHLPATISAEQAAEILGVSVYVVRRSMDDGSLPTLRLGARVRRVSTIGLCQLLSG